MKIVDYATDKVVHDFGSKDEFIGWYSSVSGRGEAGWEEFLFAMLYDDRASIAENLYLLKDSDFFC